MHKNVDILFGGQYGSEGKGVMAASLAFDYDVHVRVGAPNAGHSLIGPDGKLWKMQTVPCGWINPQAKLYIGAGGLINPKLLKREVMAIATIDPTIYDRLYIDTNCGVLDDIFANFEGGTSGLMHKRIGSTGEGVGPARQARITRRPEDFRLFKHLADDDSWFRKFLLYDVSGELEDHISQNRRILLEGAQGQGLSLIHGPWPYCTSTDPGPAQLCADVGISISRIDRIIACFRTYPIRVAGNSGPLKNEITWSELSTKLHRNIEERTTVTKKIRRVALWDDNLAKTCRILHRPNVIALMFVDYLNTDDTGIDEYDKLSTYSKQFIDRVERIMQAPVLYIGTGGPQLTVIKR